MTNKQISPHTIIFVGIGRDGGMVKNLQYCVLTTFSVPCSQVCENSENICHHELT